MKARRDAYRKLKEKHGITTSAMFNGGLDDPISDEDYDLIIKIMTSAFDDLDKGEFEEDEGDDL
ncbi:hypothetical protein [Enterococcus sp. AZ109]|uniref:hypothetical protein n=1 Tax=Enterococcus sp. AZ109 TaxID=2774634 RepID=UPI003F230A11